MRHKEVHVCVNKDGEQHHTVVIARAQVIVPCMEYVTKQQRRVCANMLGQVRIASALSFHVLVRLKLCCQTIN